MDDMPHKSGPALRKGTYYARLRIPEDVQKLILSKPARWKEAVMNPGSPLSNWGSLVKGRGRSVRVKQEIAKSLRTKDIYIAQERYSAAMKELRSLFNLIRRVLAEHERLATDDDLKLLALRFYAPRDAQSDANLSSAALDDHDRNEAREAIQEDLMAHGSADPLLDHHFSTEASLMLSGNGFQDNPHSRGVLAGYLRRADKLLARRNLLRVDRETIGLPTDDTLFPSGTTDLPRNLTTLKEAFDDYKAIKLKSNPHYKTEQKYDQLWQMMADVFGPTTPIAMLTREDARRFDRVVTNLPPYWKTKSKFTGMTPTQAAEKAIADGDEGLSFNTRKSRLEYLSAFLGWAENEGLVTKNVGKGLVGRRKRGEKRPKRQSFTTDDLKLLFGSGYPSAARPYGNGRPPLDPKKELPTDARYWAPLIALFTGMRLSEICQLTKGEFTTINGIDCILAAWDLDEPDNDEDEEQITRSRKTDAADRPIPIVDELKKLGLLELVATIDGDDHQRIFPALKPDKRGHVSPPVSRWFGRYKEAVGIDEPRKVFHSFRHTFRDALSDAGASHEVMVAVGGWSAKDQSDGYGSGGRVKRAHKELSRVKYEGLDLSPLFRPLSR